MNECHACGTLFPDEVDECPSCAADSEPFKCARCGEDFRGSDSCPACGGARAEFACARHETVPALGRCVICSAALCRDCRGRDGRALLCADHSAVNVIQGWAQIYSTTSEFEAQLVRENLLAEGIEARIFSQKDQMFSVDLGELSIVRILVPVWEFEGAERVMRDHMDVDGEVTFACPGCGEAYDQGAVKCEACGTPLGMGRPD